MEAIEEGNTYSFNVGLQSDIKESHVREVWKGFRRRSVDNMSSHDGISKSRPQDGIGLKRTASEVSSASKMESIVEKRVKSSFNCPGQLRLTKDIKELSELEQVHVEKTLDPATINIVFHDYSDSLSDENSSPNLFAVTISWYYPHQYPKVTCLDGEFFNTSHISANGMVMHPELKENWTAIGSLINVVEILSVIRNDCRQSISNYDLQP